MTYSIRPLQWEKSDEGHEQAQCDLLFGLRAIICDEDVILENGAQVTQYFWAISDYEDAVILRIPHTGNFDTVEDTKHQFELFYLSELRKLLTITREKVS